MVSLFHSHISLVCQVKYKHTCTYTPVHSQHKLLTTTSHLSGPLTPLYMTVLFILNTLLRSQSTWCIQVLRSPNLF